MKKKKAKTVFKKVDQHIDFPAMEKKILEHWYKDGIVDKYLHKNDKSKKRFSFLDGPITANNPMGVQHVHGRTLKDFFQRYKNAQGYRQRFQNGFDCQGLWLEVQEEKDLGLNSKRDIEKFGVEKFCIRCRQRVDKFSQIQTEQSKRLGMFMDWENSYYTMSEQNNLYIWYFLKKCHEKGWLYKGVDSMPWCPRCGTAISQHELSDDGYKVVEHTSVYAKFPLSGDPSTFLLIWTTTPWTLAVNVAVAVNPENKYVKVLLNNGQKLILSANRLGSIKDEKKIKILETFLGSKLVGTLYNGPFDELPATNGVEHRVIPWKDVSDSEGSGLVHIAPGAGEEDFDLGKQFGLKVLAPLDEFGFYLEGYDFLTGKFSLDVKEEVFDSLKTKGLFYKTEPIIHSYPHCWRCKQELVFRATTEWFISSKEIRPLMRKAARVVNWIPKSALKRMEDWLTNMGDWPISRRRYWGLALPFYDCGCGEVTIVGSKEELRSMAIDKKMVDDLPELHRPWIDAIKIKCPKCSREVERVKEVGDCWLDAGIVPFSTVNYLEDRKNWRLWYPFDFITEYLGQIKLWFYSTLFMSVTLENQAPWKNVLATAYIVDEKGEPMHKTKGNYIPFDEASEKMGVDVMRWVSLVSNPFDNIKFGYLLGEEVRRRFILKLWNIYNFFVTYSVLDDWHPRIEIGGKPKVLDLWILTLLDSTIIEVTSALERYDASMAAIKLEQFVDDLSLWYVRRSRDRVGPSAVDKEDRDLCHATLYTVLVTLMKVLAPFIPFLADEVYTNLTGEESVHLASWPEVKTREVLDSSLIEQMRVIRLAAERGLAQRKLHQIKVRQPLSTAMVEASVNCPDVELIKLLTDELNVKEVKWRKVEGCELAVNLETKLTAELEEEGKARELIRQVQDKRKELGLALDQKVTIYSPYLPDNQSLKAGVMRQTLAVKLEPGNELEVKAVRKR